MLYVFFGKDESSVRERALTRMGELTPNPAEAARVSAEEYSEGIFADFAKSVSLFGGENVILVDSPSSDADFKSAVLENLDIMDASVNHFVLIEGGLLAPLKKTYSKSATEIEEVTSETPETFNAFALTDAFLKRDKKSLWTLFMKARENGESVEAVAGILFWQIKILRLVERTQSAEEAEQKPFVYNKAKTALRNFKQGELDRLSRELVVLYHHGHQGRGDMNGMLEKWILDA